MNIRFNPKLESSHHHKIDVFVSQHLKMFNSKVNHHSGPIK